MWLGCMGLKFIMGWVGDGGGTIFGWWGEGGGGFWLKFK